MKLLPLLASTALLGVVVCAGSASAQSFDYDDGPPPPRHHRWWGYPPPPPYHGWHQRLRWGGEDRDYGARADEWQRADYARPVRSEIDGRIRQDFGQRGGRFGDPDCE